MDGYTGVKYVYFNPRPPWGGRHSTDFPSYVPISDFNPRPPWGGRLGDYSDKNGDTKFQSTPSVGRATIVAIYDVSENMISIHALRGEGDDIVEENGKLRTTFQSTPSVGRATSR